MNTRIPAYTSMQGANVHVLNAVLCFVIMVIKPHGIII